LDPFIPIFQRGILYGSPTIREVSAAGLGELISLTSSKNLAGPMIVKMTGPLLRIVGDRNPSTVKIAILKTLGLILVKGGPALRAFVPQFQTTFVKALSDPSRQVRMEAIDALSLLMPLSTRVDPLIKELVSGSLGKNAPVEGLGAAAVQTATLEALAVVLSAGGDKAKLPASIPSALDASIELLKGPDDGIRGAAAKVLGEACSLSGPDVVQDTIRAVILDPSDNDSSYARHGKACAIRRILASRAGGELGPALIGDLRRLCVGYVSDDKSLVREAGFVALGAVIGRTPDPKAGFAMHQPDLLKVLGDSREVMDVHRSLAKGLCLALSMVPDPNRLDAMGVPLVDACLQLTLSGTQRVQFALYDVLWMALDVASGSDGLDRYASMALFDNVRAMKSLHSKVLVKIKEVSLE
jgi:HEAT repeat protein